MHICTTGTLYQSRSHESRECVYLKMIFMNIKCSKTQMLPVLVFCNALFLGIDQHSKCRRLLNQSGDKSECPAPAPCTPVASWSCSCSLGSSPPSTRASPRPEVAVGHTNYSLGLKCINMDIMCGVQAAE